MDTKPSLSSSVYHWEIVRDKGYKMALSMKIHSATLFKLSHHEDMAR